MAKSHLVEKLVRDLIPELIRKNGDVPLVRRLNDQAIRPFVAQKILEEAMETSEAMSLGDPEKVRLELADLLEVMERAMTLHGLTWEDVKATQLKRRQSTGGFQDNLLLSLPHPHPERLYTGAQRPLLDALRNQLLLCTRAHLAVSFVMRSGLTLLMPDLQAALERGAQIQLVTSDYLSITEPEALEMLLALRGDLQLRAYCEPQRSYHPKVYIFMHTEERGVAFIGSSNLSRYALQSGVEWNYEVKTLDAGWPLAELLTRYEELFESEHSLPVDAAFIERYRRGRIPRNFVEAESFSTDIEPPRPRKAQLEAMEQLERLRDEGESKGLVIAATGIGKTYLAAFDSQHFKRVLFVAHRDELLNQANDSFGKVRPEARLGFYKAEVRDLEADVLFASVFTLSKPEHFTQFARDHFDYIVVDEVHHAAAKSYRAILNYFTPTFLLGLTATPYRGDHRDVFALCDGNVAYKLTFMEAIALKWLVPFHYFGIYDKTDYELVPRRNGSYVEDVLGKTLANEQRAKMILEEYQKHQTGPGLGFCVNIEHAKFMADYFHRHGVAAMAVYSGKDSPARKEALQKLRAAEVSVLFTVDLFNEGVDIPELDLVMFLRPTESTTVFLQQLGRGLRLHHSKEFLTVLDFIGNYKMAHYKIALLVGQVEDEPDAKGLQTLIAAYKKETLQRDLPEGVQIHLGLQVIDLIQQLMKEQDPWRNRLIQAYQDLVESLERQPTLLELHLWGQYEVPKYLREFRRWNEFLKSQGLLTPQATRLEEEVGAFLAEIERTDMSRAYKMVVLKTFVEEGGLERPVHVSALVLGFRRFYLQQNRHARDIKGTKVEDITQVPDHKLLTYLEGNPLAAWTNAGKEGRTVFFVYDRSAGLFQYCGPRASDPVLFAEAVLERALYRLEHHFLIRYERKNVFKVQEASDTSEEGIIFLGNDESLPIPHSQGWKTVLIGKHRLFAKFEKHEIRVAKTEAVDNPQVPNRLTSLLEELFGPRGYHKKEQNQVRISPAEGEQDVWVIEPVKQFKFGRR